MSTVGNPYNFEKPVKPELFAGRNKELSEIDYYLELSKASSPTYHNLALVGQRATGKTSLLNMISYMAEKKGMLSIKVSLNAETSTSDVILFKEIFDSIMTRGAEFGLYGGITGNVYKSFRKLVDVLDVNVEIPLLFGTAYVGAKKEASASIPQQVLIHDLTKIWEEAKKHNIPAIVLMFDECDLLSSNETLLQKLRNIFSDLEGYIIVFSGTEKMFPALSEVFSPVPRFFKRIDVGNFQSAEETKECVLKPLPEQERNLVDLGSVWEIHAITRGNPYEVQLISHYMYKKYKELNAPRIALNVDVLDSVLNELERLRKGGIHQIADTIRMCNRDQLKVLLATIECPSATAYQLCRFIVLSEIDSTSLEDIATKFALYDLTISELKGKAIAESTDGGLSFSGDHFDILYLKYFALSKGIKSFQLGIPSEMEMNVESKFVDTLLKDLQEYEVNIRFDGLEPLQGVNGYRGQKAVFGGKFLAKATKPGEKVALFEISPAELDKRFYLGAPDSIRFRTNIEWLGSGFVVQITVKDPKDLEIVTQRIDLLRNKLRILGLDILLKDEVELTNEANELRKKGDFEEALKKFDEALKLNQNYELAWANKGLTFFQRGDFENALRCFEKWSEIRPRLPEAWENRGRALFHLRRFNDALLCFQKAVDLGPEMWSAWDNKGRSLLNLRRFDEAIISFDRSLSLKAENIDALLLKGICLNKVKKFEEAIKCLDLVLTRNPQHTGAIAEKARAFFELGDYDESETCLNEFLQIDPNNIKALDLMSVVIYKQGKAGKALEYSNKALMLDQSYAPALYNRACYFAKSGRVEESLVDLEKAINFDSAFMELAKKEDDFSVLRDNPRFKSLIGESANEPEASTFPE
jgi:tetratricopeptide (TPR) repeat protein